MNPPGRTEVGVDGENGVSRGERWYTSGGANIPKKGLVAEKLQVPALAIVVSGGVEGLRTTLSVKARRRPPFAVCRGKSGFGA